VVEIAEPGEKGLRQRFRVPAPDRAIQHHFEQLVVGHRIGAAVREALAQAEAMGVAMQFRPRRRPAGARHRDWGARKGRAHVIEGEAGLVRHVDRLRRKRLTEGFHVRNSVRTRHGAIRPRWGGTGPRAKA
jgi:hypothetical protein